MRSDAIIKKAMLKVRAAIHDEDPLAAISELVVAFEALEEVIETMEERHRLEKNRVQRHSGQNHP